MSDSETPREHLPAKTPPAIVRWLVTGFGAGQSRFAPGTVGSVWGLPLTVLLALLPARPFLASAVLVVLIVVAVRLADRGERWLGGKDPRPVVIDEYVTLPIVCLWTPINVLYLAIGFVLHRGLDILKPFPARKCEKFGGGLGIVMDDVVSSIYGAVVLVVLHYALHLSDQLAQHAPGWLTAPWW